VLRDCQAEIPNLPHALMPSPWSVADTFKARV
jgi:hypothetical protein